MAVSWEEKFNKIEKEYNEYKTSTEAQLSELRSISTPKLSHNYTWWKEISRKCITEPDAIKLLIKNKELSLTETNFEGRTVMLLAARSGAYQLTQFCINSGADLNHKDDHGMTAVDLANQSGYFNVQQLLLFAQLNVNIGNEIKITAETIHKQNGINQNILNELSLIGKQSKELFEKLLMELMLNIINKRLSFDDTLLNLCWEIASRDGQNPLKSELWKTISMQCELIIKNGIKRDWYWFQKILLPSTVDLTNIHSSTHNLQSLLSFNLFFFFCFSDLVPGYIEQ